MRLFSVFLIICILVFSPFILCARPGFFEPWGKDSELIVQNEAVSKAVPVSIAAKIANAVIYFHQNVISPVDGPRSHFRPSSSQYMKLAILKYGFLRGFVMGCDRLLRENDEEWVYRVIQENGKFFKYDPAQENKYAGGEYHL